MKRASTDSCEVSENGRISSPTLSVKNKSCSPAIECIEYIETGAEWEEDKSNEGGKAMISVGTGMVVRHGRKVRVEMKVPQKVHREYCQLHRDLRSQFVFMEHQKESLAAEANSYFHNREGEYDFISRALACTYLSGMYPKLRTPLIVLARIGETSFHKYRKLLEQENSSLSLDGIALKLRGSQVLYTPENDAKFIRWLKDPKTSLKKKTTKEMMQEYDNISGSKCKVTRQHICFLLHRNGWRMAKPDALDVERCISYEVLDEWFQKPRIRELLANVDKRLLFNADETDLNRKNGAPKWIATEKHTRVTYITRDHSGSHVSLFLMVSAGGKPVYPFALLHGPPDNYCEDYDSSIVQCFRTKKGYMEKTTFDEIMRKIFVPYVITQRTLLKLSKKAPAVLVVDGHSSRYNPSTLRYLRRNFIHLLILPAHSSHILQPLDLTLNHLVKDAYKKEYPLAESRMLEEKKRSTAARVEITPLPPSSKRQEVEQLDPNVTAEENDVHDSNHSASTPLIDSNESEEVQEVTEEEEEPQAVIGEDNEAQAVSKKSEEKENGSNTLTLAERRTVMVEAATNSVMSSLIRRTILPAWRASGLSPLMEHPPYTRENADKLQNQAIEMGVFPNSKRRVVHLTGVITDKEQLQAIEELIAKRGQIEGKQYTYRRKAMSALGQIIKEYIVNYHLADVGDYEYLDDDPNSLQSDVNNSAIAEQATITESLPNGDPVRLNKQLSQGILDHRSIISWLKQQNPNPDVTKLVEQLEQTFKRKPKNSSSVASAPACQAPVHRGRGRPKKSPPVPEADGSTVHRGRGRPKKTPSVPEVHVPEVHGNTETVNTVEQPTRRRRGRPRKSTSVPEVHGSTEAVNTVRQSRQRRSGRPKKSKNTQSEASQGLANTTSLRSQSVARRAQRLLRGHGHHIMPTNKLRRHCRRTYSTSGMLFLKKLLNKRRSKIRTK